MSADNERRWAHYLVCLERGHQSSGTVTASVPPKNICKFCGSLYWTECVERESNMPTDPTLVSGIASDYADSAE